MGSNKAKSNLRKHKVCFEVATSVFKDKNLISVFDESHSENEEKIYNEGL